jgi:putative oxidoreductase
MVSDSFQATWSPRILSVVRIVAALLFMQFGLSKHFGFPAASPASFQAFGLIGAAGAIEIVAGGLMAIGLCTRVAAFVASGEMAFAYFMRHFPLGFFPQANGGNLAVLFCFIFLYIALAGGGPWSIDALRKAGVEGQVKART